MTTRATLYRVAQVKCRTFFLKLSDKVKRDLTLKLHSNEVQTISVLPVKLHRELSSLFVTRDQQLATFTGGHSQHA